VTEDSSAAVPSPGDSVLRPLAGTSVTFRWRKWDGAPHWVHENVYLGGDEWGDWVGQKDGWRSVRPGRDVVAEGPNVTLVPPGGAYACTINQTHPRIRIYIDLAWDVRWSETESDVIEGIDMDLDVVRALDERGLYIDDRDEWDEHRLRYGYPADIVTLLEQLAVDLERRVGAFEAPFDDATAERWFARLAAL
jgi:hypothetical protein